LSGASGDQRQCLIVAKQSGTHGMDCRGLPGPGTGALRMRRDSKGAHRGGRPSVNSKWIAYFLTGLGAL
jgi:hypothetical protein